MSLRHLGQAHFQIYQHEDAIQLSLKQQCPHLTEYCPDAHIKYIKSPICSEMTFDLLNHKK